MLWPRTEAKDYLALSQNTNQILRDCPQVYFSYHFLSLEQTVLNTEPGAQSQDLKEVSILGKKKGPHLVWAQHFLILISFFFLLSR